VGQAATLRIGVHPRLHFLTGLQDRQALNIEYRTSNAEYRKHLVGQAATLFMKGCLLSSNMLSLFSCFLFLRQLSAMQ
jgi:hypothetical protein